MKLSAKTRYAARILLYLAKYGIERPISSSKLATQTGISSQFIEQILRQLRLAGITGSIRGARGGHVLLRKPEDLTFGCIVKLMEGVLNFPVVWKNPATACVLTAAKYVAPGKICRPPWTAFLNPSLCATSCRTTGYFPPPHRREARLARGRCSVTTPWRLRKQTPATAVCLR